SESYGIIATAILGQSPRQQPVGPLVVPGTYQAVLTVAGQSLTRSVTVSADPRVAASPADFDAALGWQLALSNAISASHAAIESLRAMRQTAHARAPASSPAEVVSAVQTFDRAALTAISGLAGNRGLVTHLGNLEFADMVPNDTIVGVLHE